jgi:hypothetical protein
VTTAERRRIRPTVPSIPGWQLLVVAVAVGFGLALLDFIPPGREWWAGHPMTSQAIGGAILFVQGGLLLTGFLGRREQQRIDRVAAAAYAALSQAANDAGRRLLAPLNGADLHELGIGEDDPGRGSTRSAAEIDRERLVANGFAVSFAEHGGTWRDQRGLLEDRLPILLRDPAFVRRLFRAGSRARRDMQASAAQWGPTMLADGERTDDLNQLRELIYAVENLIERLRESHVISLDAPDWVAPPGFVSGTIAAYWAAIDKYGAVRKHLVRKANLASDAWSERAAIEAANSGA